MIKLFKLSTKDNPSKTNKGVILLLTILILVANLAIALGVTSLMVGELRITREASMALRAFYGAEAGIERKLYEIRKAGNISNIGNPPSCINDGFAICLPDPEVPKACYSVSVLAGGTGGCPGTVSYCIKSYGCHKKAKRTIEVSY